MNIPYSIDFRMIIHGYQPTDVWPRNNQTHLFCWWGLFTRGVSIKSALIFSAVQDERARIEKAGRLELWFWQLNPTVFFCLSCRMRQGPQKKKLRVSCSHKKTWWTWWFSGSQQHCLWRMNWIMNSSLCWWRWPWPWPRMKNLISHAFWTSTAPFTTLTLETSDACLSSAWQSSVTKQSLTVDQNGGKLHAGWRKGGVRWLCQLPNLCREAPCSARAGRVLDFLKVALPHQIPHGRPSKTGCWDES